MRDAVWAAGAAVLIAVAACGGTAVVDGENPIADDDDGSGGNGANTTTAGNGGTGANTGGSTSVGGTTSVGGSGGSGNCARCGDVIMGGFEEIPELCPESQQLFADLFDCVCGFGCPMECGMSVCAGQQPDSSCIDCLTNVCVFELQACFSDQ